MKRIKAVAQPVPSSFGSFGIALKIAITKNSATPAIAALTNNIHKNTGNDGLAAGRLAAGRLAVGRLAADSVALWTPESSTTEKCHTGPRLCKKYAMTKNGYAKVRDVSFTYLTMFIDKGSTGAPKMRDRFSSMPKHISAALCLATAATLSGCVTSHPPAVPHPIEQATARYDAVRTQIHVAGGMLPKAPSVPAQRRARAAVAAHIHPDEPLFQRAVWRLQSLGYLPITHAYIRGALGTDTRHDNFLWPVPAGLQKAADQYAWDAQNPFIRGAVIQFERANGLLEAKGVSEGRIHKSVLHVLFSPEARKDPWKWEWTLVNKAAGTNIPERLSVWTPSQGWVWHTRVNTGVMGVTPNGTWPIYQRLPITTMQGVFPVPVSPLAYAALKGHEVPQWAGGTLMQSARGMVNSHPVRWQPYSDPGIKWVNYFNDGLGIHYYPRAAYGFPQSAGCVEEPLKAARITYGLLHYGVPVTVSKAGMFPARVSQ